MGYYCSNYYVCLPPLSCTFVWPVAHTSLFTIGLYPLPQHRLALRRQMPSLRGRYSPAVNACIHRRLTFHRSQASKRGASIKEGLLSEAERWGSTTPRSTLGDRRAERNSRPIRDSRVKN
ncbi:hypothetical protein LZ31DRAFT_550135 [Colletotrichum somersetense]|nr:hypothetical protein LZ31DRAFT_550135 [Colletotrichum somersetense]